MQDTEELISSIEIQARAFFKDARGSHGWDHVMRVFHLCEKIGPRENCGMAVLRAAALLHDIGRGECDEDNGARCHAEVGGGLAREILDKAGADPQFVEEVVHCVESHRFRQGIEPDSMEAKVLFDADKLDSIGAIGVGRAFQFAGEVGARLHDPDVDPENTESYSVEDTAYREYLVKLRHIRERMLTKTGREFAAERHEFMESFFARLNRESAGEL